MVVFPIPGVNRPAFFLVFVRENGARERPPKGHVAVGLAPAGGGVVGGVRDYEHRRALNALSARSYENADPLRVSAYPAMIDPFHWYGVVEASSFFALAPVNSLEPEVDPEGRLDIHYKPEETPVTLAAKNSYLGRVYLSWAQYPITETEA